MGEKWNVVFVLYEGTCTNLPFMAGSVDIHRTIRVLGNWDYPGFRVVLFWPAERRYPWLHHLTHQPVALWYRRVEETVLNRCQSGMVLVSYRCKWSLPQFRTAQCLYTRDSTGNAGFGKIVKHKSLPAKRVLKWVR